MTYKPGLPITFDVSGRVIELRYPLKVLREMETQHDMNYLTGEAKFGNIATNPEKLALLIWYGAKTTQPDITLEWVEENIDAHMLLDLLPVIMYATTGQRSDKPVRPNGAAPDSLGLTSGPTVDMTSDSASLKSGT